jgi:hypothetical protein
LLIINLQSSIFNLQSSILAFNPSFAMLYHQSPMNKHLDEKIGENHLFIKINELCYNISSGSNQIQSTQIKIKSESNQSQMNQGRNE